MPPVFVGCWGNLHNPFSHQWLLLQWRRRHRGRQRMRLWGEIKSTAPIRRGEEVCDNFCSLQERDPASALVCLVWQLQPSLAIEWRQEEDSVSSLCWHWGTERDGTTKWGGKNDLEIRGRSARGAGRGCRTGRTESTWAVQKSRRDLSHFHWAVGSDVSGQTGEKTLRCKQLHRSSTEAIKCSAGLWNEAEAGTNILAGRGFAWHAVSMSLPVW